MTITAVTPVAVAIPDILSIAVDVVETLCQHRCFRPEVAVAAIGRAIADGNCTEIDIEWGINRYRTDAFGEQVFFAAQPLVFGGVCHQLA